VPYIVALLALSFAATPSYARVSFVSPRDAISGLLIVIVLLVALYVWFRYKTRKP
jgi:hypothetical protein